MIQVMKYIKNAMIPANIVMGMEQKQITIALNVEEIQKF